MLDSFFLFFSFLLKLKVPCNFGVKYTGTCVNTWNESARHWATPVFMPRFVRFLSVWKRAARHFCLGSIWADIRVKQIQACAHIHALTCARTHARSHCDSFFLSLPVSHTIHNPRPFCTLRWQCQLQRVFWLLFFCCCCFVVFCCPPPPLSLWRPYWLSALSMLTSKRWLILLSPVFQWSLVPYGVQHGCS